MSKLPLTTAITTTDSAGVCSNTAKFSARLLIRGAGGKLSLNTKMNCHHAIVSSARTSPLASWRRRRRNNEKHILHHVSSQVTRCSNGAIKT